MDQPKLFKKMIPEKLAIVVPAYRPQFLLFALNSISSQINQNFNCYIFDDAAVDEVRIISQKFPKFQYKRFEENMGQKNLVGHWHRCLSYIKEKWVWLFSDDDIMEPNCVNEFYKMLNIYPSATAFRFSRTNINSNGEIIKRIKPFRNETGFEYLNSRISRKTSSCLQDHIFNWHKLLEINNGFVNFPLAWCSDDAAWCLLGDIHEIVSIAAATVQIRNSGINITSLKDKNTIKTKLYSYNLFYQWCSSRYYLPLLTNYYFVKLFVKLSNKTPVIYYLRPSIFRNKLSFFVITLIFPWKIYKYIKQFLRS